MGDQERQVQEVVPVHHQPDLRAERAVSQGAVLLQETGRQAGTQGHHLHQGRFL